MFSTNDLDLNLMTLTWLCDLDPFCEKCISGYNSGTLKDRNFKLDVWTAGVKCFPHMILVLISWLDPYVLLGWYAFTIWPHELNLTLWLWSLKNTSCLNYKREKGMGSVCARVVALEEFCKKNKQSSVGLCLLVLLAVHVPGTHFKYCWVGRGNMSQTPFPRVKMND